MNLQRYLTQRLIWLLDQGIETNVKFYWGSSLLNTGHRSEVLNEARYIRRITEVSSLMCKIISLCLILILCNTINVIIDFMSIFDIVHIVYCLYSNYI